MSNTESNEYNKYKELIKYSLCNKKEIIIK